MADLRSLGFLNYKWLGKEHTLSGLSRVLFNKFPHSSHNFSSGHMHVFFRGAHMPMVGGKRVKELMFPVKRGNAEGELHEIASHAENVIFDEDGEA